MSARTRLLLFVLGLAIVFAASAGVGAMVPPVHDDLPRTEREHDGGHEEGRARDTASTATEVVA